MGFSIKIRGCQDRSAKHHSRFILWQNRAKSHRAHTAEICYKPLLKVDNEGTSRILMPRERGITVEYALTRRSALGAAGAGAVLFTVASCSNERSDYAGEVKLEKYDNSAGSFEAATRDTPPKNVPKPIKPENADEKSVAGFYASLAYIAAAMQYMFATGDTGPYDDSALTEDEKHYVHNSSNEQILARMREGQNWYENPRVTISLNTAQPAMEGDTYTWEGKFSMEFGNYRVDRGQVNDLTERQKSNTEDMVFKGMYTNGRWSIETRSKTVASQSSTATP